MAVLIDSVRRNFGLKATAAIVAVLLWFTFNYFSSIHAGYSKTIDVPVTLRGVGAGLVASTQVQHVTVELSGVRADVDSAGASEFSAYVDCSGKSPGVYAFAVNVTGLNGDLVKAVVPAQAVVALDRYGYRMVPVVARDTHGGPLANALLVPALIAVAGAQSSVAQVLAAEVSVPEPRALPAGFAAEMRPVPVDQHMAPVAGVTALGVVRVTSQPNPEVKPSK
jgi:YbbR domain-containing protein